MNKKIGIIAILVLICLLGILIIPAPKNHRCGLCSSDSISCLSQDSLQKTLTDKVTDTLKGM